MFALQREVTALLVLLGFCLTALPSAHSQADEQLVEKIDQLVRQLNDDRAQSRDEAEQALLKLAPSDGEKVDAFLRLLPEPEEGMPEEVKLRLVRLRREIQSRQAKGAIEASRVTLAADGVPLADVFEEIHKQTGNRLSDFRQQFGQDAPSRSVTLQIQDEEFWPAIDELLDQAKLATYSFSGEDSLAIVNQEAGSVSRTGQACYAGPFRVEAVNIVAQRNLRNPGQQSSRLELEVAWEPRLRPIVLTQSVQDVKLTGDDGQPIAATSRQAVLDVEVQPGNHATELVIPFELPQRSVQRIDSLQGEISALVPGRVVDFKFKDLDKGSQEEQQGGVKVHVDRVHKNHGLWEVHMRLEVLSEEAGLESHRGWVFQNITYLIDKAGNEIDHAGMETTIQTEQEVGLAYFFEIPDGDISSCTWVYRTPAAIVRVPVKYVLRDLPLP